MLKQINIFISSSIFVIISSALVLYANHKSHDHFKKFYSSPLDGRIIEVEINSRSDNFKLNDGEHYYFDGITDYTLNNNTFFSSVVEVGDFVYKEAFSDTLHLIKTNNERYSYTFLKPRKFTK